MALAKQDKDAISNAHTVLMALAQDPIMLAKLQERLDLQAVKVRDAGSAGQLNEAGKSD